MPKTSRAQPQEPPLLMSPEEAAYMLNVSRRTVDNLAAAGHLEKVKIKMLVRITRASVLKFAKQGEPDPD